MTFALLAIWKTRSLINRRSRFRTSAGSGHDGSNDACAPLVQIHVGGVMHG